MESKNLGKLAFTSALGVILSSTFLFLAALPMRQMRLQFGRFSFLVCSLAWTTILVAIQQWEWAMAYFLLSFLVGSYREFEERKFSLFQGSLLSIAMTSGLGVLSVGLMAKLNNLAMVPFLEKQFAPFMKYMEQMPQFQQQPIELAMVIGFLPSIMIVLLMVTLFVSLSIPAQGAKSKGLESLKKFTLPDFVIWLFIGSLAGAFLLEEKSTGALICLNALTVVLAAYFFQGLAVLSAVLDYVSIHGIWRFLIYLFACFQLNLFVSFLGVLDYWFDFRKKLQRKTGEYRPKREEKL